MSEETTQAAVFRKMATLIDLNSGATFSGALVAIPPKDGGSTIELLVLDTAQSPAQFWALLKTKCEIELQQLDEKSRNTQAFGRR